MSNQLMQKAIMRNILKIEGVISDDCQKYSMNDLKKLKQMDVARYIYNLPSDIMYCTNLEKIIAINTSENIDILIKLPSLRDVTLVGKFKHIQDDMQKIYSMTQLTKLNLCNTTMTSLNGIQRLCNLETLDVSSNPISSLKPIASLKKLYSFCACYAGIVDISDISSCTNLTHLAMSHNKIQDISPIINLTNLEFINFDNNCINNVKPLMSFLQNHIKSKHTIKSFSMYGQYITQHIKDYDRPIKLNIIPFDNKTLYCVKHFVKSNYSSNGDYDIIADNKIDACVVSDMLYANTPARYCVDFECHIPDDLQCCIESNEYGFKPLLSGSIILERDGDEKIIVMQP